MSDEAAFLAAIRAEPDDDTVRLVYADWLDEHGDAARAKFIRVQCERERLVAETESGAYRCAHVRLVAETESGAYRCAHVGVTADVLVADLMPPDARRYLALDPRSEAARTVALVVRADAPGVMPMLTRWDGVEVTRFDLAPDGLRLTGRAGDHGRWVEGFRELVRRERELLKAGHADWCRLPIVFVPRLSEEPLQQYNARYRRGFLADICCAAHDWLAHAEAIRAVHPVTRVTLTTFPPHAWQMANLPPNWPLHAHRFSQTDAPRHLALDALEHRYPGVTFDLSPAGFREPPRDEQGRWVALAAAGCITLDELRGRLGLPPVGNGPFFTPPASD